MANETTTLETILKLTGIDQVIASFKSLGSEGPKAFNQIADSAEKVSKPLNEVAKAVDAQVAPMGAIAAAAKRVGISYDEMALRAKAASQAVSGSADRMAVVGTAAQVAAARAAGLTRAFTGIGGAAADAGAGIDKVKRPAAEAAAGIADFTLNVGGMRRVLGAIRPVVQEFGGSIGLLSGIARAGRAGIIGFAGAIAGVLVVALAKAADEARITRDRLTSILRNPEEGARAFEAVEASAKRAGVATSDFADITSKLFALFQTNQELGFTLNTSRIELAQRALETLSKQLTLSGSTADQSKKIIDELFTDIAKNGGLTADAFGKLLAQAPQLAKALANALEPSKSFEQFVKQIAQTPVSLTRFQLALERLGPTTDDAFKDFQKTIPQALDETGAALERLAQSSGGIKLVADTLGLLTKVIEALNSASKEGVVQQTLVDTLRAISPAAGAAAAAYRALNQEIKGSRFDEAANSLKRSGDELAKTNPNLRDAAEASARLRAEFDKSAESGNRFGVALARINEAFGELGSKGATAIKSGIQQQIDDSTKRVTELKQRIALVVAAQQRANEILNQGAASLSTTQTQATEKTKELGSAIEGLKGPNAIVEQGFASMQKQIEDTVAAVKELDDATSTPLKIDTNIPEKTKEVEDVLQTLSDRFKSTFESFGTQTTPLSNALKKLVGEGQGAGAAIVTSLGKVGDKAKESATKVSSLAQAISDAAKRLQAGTGTAADEILAGDQGSVQVAGRDFAANPFAAKLKDIMPAASAAGSAAEDVGNKVSEAGKKISAAGEEIGNVPQKFAALAEGTQGAGEQIVTNLVTPLQGVPQQVAGAVEGIGPALEAPFSEAKTAIASTLDQILNDIRQFVAEAKSLADQASTTVANIDSGGGGGGGTESAYHGGLLGGRAGRDANLGWFTKGEFVFTRQAVRHWGLSNLRAMLALRDPWQHFSVGGLVDGLARSMPMSATVRAPAYALGGPTKSRRTTVDLSIDRRPIGSFDATEDAARNLQRVAARQKTVRMGPDPNWRR